MIISLGLSLVWFLLFLFLQFTNDSHSGWPISISFWLPFGPPGDCKSAFRSTVQRDQGFSFTFRFISTSHRCHTPVCSGLSGFNAVYLRKRCRSFGAFTAIMERSDWGRQLVCMSYAFLKIIIRQLPALFHLVESG